MDQQTAYVVAVVLAAAYWALTRDSVMAHLRAATFCRFGWHDWRGIGAGWLHCSQCGSVQHSIDVYGR